MAAERGNMAVVTAAQASTRRIVPTLLHAGTRCGAERRLDAFGRLAGQTIESVFRQPQSVAGYAPAATKFAMLACTMGRSSTYVTPNQRLAVGSTSQVA